MARIYLEYQGNSIELPPGENVLGRDIMCRIRFNDPSVSRQHLRIVVDYKSALAEDLRSTNGSSVNGERLLKTRPLLDGDQVKIGNRVLKVRILPDAAPAESDEPDTLNEGVDDATTEAGVSPLVMEAAKETVPPPVPRLPTTRPEPLPSLRDMASMTSHQKCPECGHVVRSDEDACPSCGFFWTTGRPGARTFSERRLEAGVTVRTSEIRADAERRSATRVPVTVPVLYMSDTLTFESQARDLSGGGMFIRTELLDPVGTPCMVTVLPDGGAAVVMQAVVAHVVESRADRQGRPPGLGIKFTSVSGDAERWLRGALEESRKRL